MRIVVHSQYYRAGDALRQREIDHCLASHRHHPLVSELVLFLEAGAPTPPAGPVPCRVIPLDSRLTYAAWLAQVDRDRQTISLLVNADIQLREGLDALARVFDTPETFLALTRYNPDPAGEGARLNDFPHWTQDCWGVRGDAPISPALLHACAFPLGFPGCDNRIASVMWSHGFTLKNPSYHVRSVHHQAASTRGYDKGDDRLYGSVTYVHPSLTPTEPSALEHTLWTRAAAPSHGLVVNRQAVGGGQQSLLPADGALAAAFACQQRFNELCWSRGALGTGHTQPPAAGEDWPSEDTLFLPLAELEAGERTIRLRAPTPLAAACVRLPQRCPPGLELEILSVAADGSLTPLLEPTRAALESGGSRTFLPLRAPESGPHRDLRLRLHGVHPGAPRWPEGEGLELVLFGPESVGRAKSLRRIAEPEEPPPAERLAADRERQGEAQEALPAPPLRWRARGADAGAGEPPLARFGPRLQVRLASEGPEGERILFEDPFWPGVRWCPMGELPVARDDRLGLLLWGFGQPRLELRPDRIAAAPRHRDDSLHWWPGSRTEEQAWRAHGRLRGPQRQGQTLHQYLGLPWATFLESGRVPQTLLAAHRGRVEALAQALREFGLGLEVHSVCQHPRALEHSELFEAAGVTTLWLSHRPRGVEARGRLQLRSWHLAPFAGEDPATRPLLCVQPPQQRPFLASFQGEARGAGAALRQRLAALHHRHRWHVEIGPHWPEESTRQGEAWQRHDRVLRDSVFSLCPPGAGPNSERLWDSLAVGAIPVLLGDELALPEGIAWETIALIHPPAELESLPQRLAALPDGEIQRRSERALEAHRQRLGAVCFGAIEAPAAPVRRQATATDPALPTVLVPLHGPEDRWFWRSRKCAFHDIVLEWYLRGRVQLRFHEGSFYWWGREGEVLLFERDQIINLQDGKRNPPRWSGEVPYRHAFFANQHHLPSARHHTLPYWGYAPVLLEQVREEGRRGWPQRDIGSLFAGSVENETQEFFRNRFQGWAESIDLHACADRLNRGEPNPFSLPDYLNLIRRSRFGVCFRGNGPKCYREIECLALGTPLIVTEGLEVDYPEPLQEGLHFRRARQAEDVPRIVAETTPEQWERMSRACWDWFGRNGTIDRLLEILSRTIAGLDLHAPRHRRVRLRAGRVAGAGSLAVRSLALVDPGADVLYDEDPGDCPLELAPDDLVISELPLVGREGEIPWRLGRDRQRAFAAGIRASSHPVHQQLLSLLGVRLPNFRVRLEGPQGEIDPFDRLVNGAVVLAGPEESAELRADYDWSRRCGMKYPEVVQRVRGPARLEQTLVSAVLHYQAGGVGHLADLGPHFTDWHVAHGRLIEPQELHQALKLWEFEGCRLLEIRGEARRGAEVRPFHYRLDASGLREDGLVEG
jgi:hypothetical protein